MESLVSDDRQIDQQQVLDHIDNVLQGCEQVFEKFFLAKFIGLNFEYFPENVNVAEKDLLKIVLTFYKVFFFFTVT